LRLGEEKKKEGNKKPQGKNIGLMSASATQGGHKEEEDRNHRAEI